MDNSQNSAGAWWFQNPRFSLPFCSQPFNNSIPCANESSGYNYGSLFIRTQTFKFTPSTGSEFGYIPQHTSSTFTPVTAEPLAPSDIPYIRKTSGDELDASTDNTKQDYQFIEKPENPANYKELKSTYKANKKFYKDIKKDFKKQNKDRPERKELSNKLKEDKKEYRDFRKD